MTGPAGVHDDGAESAREADQVEESAREAGLIDAARGGDRQALDQLLRLHHDRVHAVCRRLCGNDADALDATQEALIAIVRGLPRFDGRARFATWAYRVATNACLDELRRRRRRPVAVAPETDPDRPSPSTPGVDDVVTDRLDIDAALARLPEEFRVAVVLRDLCALDYAEIAEVLGVPPGTVRSRIARGRAQLAELLRGNSVDGSRRPTPRP